MIRRPLIGAFVLAVGTLAQAGPVTPTYTTFGNLAGATFGGSGIPTNPAAITVANGLTIGLIATQRFANPALGNDGAGTYFATPGLNNGGSTWNFGFYVNSGTAPLSGYQIDLFYDLDAGVGTDLANMGRIDIDAALVAGGGGALTLVQGSENLQFAYLSSGAPGVVTAPFPAVPFSAYATGEYSFLLRVSQGNDVLATSAMLVNVNGVPEPGSLALAGVALLGLVGASRRRKA